MEQIGLNEFLEKYNKSSKHWDFEKFGLVCKKCGSNKVEFNSDIEFGLGYYDELERSGQMITKCHDCGNAHVIEAYDF